MDVFAAKNCKDLQPFTIDRPAVKAWLSEWAVPWNFSKQRWLLKEEEFVEGAARISKPKAAGPGSMPPNGSTPCCTKGIWPCSRTLPYPEIWTTHC